MSEWQPNKSDDRWQGEKDWWPDKYTVRITCDNRAHPKHKGKEIHITEFGRKYDNNDYPWPWRLSRKEISRVERHGGFNEEHPDPLTHLVRAESYDGISPDVIYMQRQRIELTCPKCGAHVPTRDEVLRLVLDKLEENGIRKVALNHLGESLGRLKRGRDYTAVSTQVDPPKNTPTLG